MKKEVVALLNKKKDSKKYSIKLKIQCIQCNKVTEANFLKYTTKRWNKQKFWIQKQRSWKKVTVCLHTILQQASKTLKRKFTENELLSVLTGLERVVVKHI